MAEIERRPEAIIQTEKLSIQVAEKTILNDVSFSLYQGQAWAIVGSSGSRKTILGKTIAGLLAPTSGQLKFNLPTSFRRLMIN